MNTSVGLSSIIADPALQPRIGGLDFDHVKALEAVAEAWPPLKVVKQGGGFLLVDGFHRFAAAQNLGLETICAEILIPPEDGDLLGLAFALNAVHGRPLTLSDRRAFAARLLKAHPDWSEREIARRAGLVQPTVSKIRQELEAQAAIAPTDSRVGRDGRSYMVPPKGQAKTPEAYQTGPTLLERIGDAFTPAERRNQREIARYLQKLADALEDQDKLTGFESIDSASDACRAVLGTEAAQELADRLGWSAENILKIAEALGYQPEDQPAAGGLG
ncbi:ParB/RepB/Spo0J family partition protein [Acidocella sp.]|uniref:ParB/RepB/Spo0J family partition protein n=1 Tax=Acidocella sp. TaxID=50710 RepID=UPI0026193B72|nr:ParB/RepB/Spo0J family partition protein [Acidocella sp.]